MPTHDEHGAPGAPLSAPEALALAESMQALATASRVRLLYALLDGDLTVEELARVTGMTPGSASHQLRLLRHRHLVVARREGRHVRYRLHDHHVAELLGAVRFHAEHVALGLEAPVSSALDAEGSLA